MHILLRYIVCLTSCCALITCAFGQDSTKKKTRVGSLVRDVYRSLMVVEHKGQDSTFFQRSEESYQRFAGKVIRHVIIRNLSFGENVNDTSHSIISALTRTADRLQANTKDWVIRDMLFVKKGQLLDPYRLADNERFLRDQNFIKDARIIVRLVTEDSVDVYVRLRDVFSWGAEVNASGVRDFTLSVYDANFLGMAQRLELTAFYDRSRSPAVGPQVTYRKTSIAGSFINVSAGYTTIDRGVSLGTENERAYFLKLDRPLYSPNARFAGGLEASWNQSTNVWNKDSLLFNNYKYQLGDVWLGYNIGVYKQKREGAPDKRNRRFVSVRYFDQHFIQPPKLDTFDVRYVNKRYVLGQFTWYKINFYRTNYIYGFGRTEDLPVGMVRKITIGPSQTDSARRIYAGWEYTHYLIDSRKNYWNYTFALGTNYYRKQWQDNSAFLNISWFSRLFEFTRFKIRQSASVNYAGIYNHRFYEPLYINNEFGLERFNTDSVRALHRYSAGFESTMYTRWSILGFKIGFFTFGRTTWMTPENTGAWRGGFFPAFGGGIRTRNENLIFGTIEARFTWFPRTLYDVNNITLRVNSNLRLKFSGSFIQPPSFAAIR
jgi:hypothetical protein